jgi:hypothetical protein
VRKGLATGTAVLSGLLWTSAGLADESFVDPAGDQRADRGGGSAVASAGPDITRVEVSNGQDGIVTFRITIANYTSLPPNAFVAVFFDLDRNVDTGDLGDEAQIGLSPSRGVTYERWDGTRMVAGPAGAILASFANGILTLAVPRTELNGAASFDFLVGALYEVDEFIATDFAPRLGSPLDVPPGARTAGAPRLQCRYRPRPTRGWEEVRSQHGSHPNRHTDGPRRRSGHLHCS